MASNEKSISKSSKQAELGKLANWLAPSPYCLEGRQAWKTCSAGLEELPMEASLPRPAGLEDLVNKHGRLAFMSKSSKAGKLGRLAQEAWKTCP